MKKRATMKDIANDLGVSLSIINKALNNKSGVSPEMRERILDSADRLGYKMNKVAQSMARACIEIAVVIPSAWHEYYDALKKGIDEEFLRLFDYNVESKYYYVKSSHSCRETVNALEQCIEDGMQGVILCDAFPVGLEKSFEKLNEKNIPVVIIGGLKSLSDKYLCSIQVDAYRSGRMAAEMLSLSIEKGSDTMIFVGNKDIDEHRLKIEGFIDEAKKRNLNVVGIYETHDDPDIAYLLTKKAFDENRQIGGIYSATANSASICRYLDEINSAVRVVGTDIYNETANYLEKGIMQCIIFQNLEKHGRISVRTIYEYLTEKKLVDKTVYVTPQLILNSNLEAYYSKNNSAN